MPSNDTRLTKVQAGRLLRAAQAVRETKFKKQFSMMSFFSIPNEKHPYGTPMCVIGEKFVRDSSG